MSKVSRLVNLTLALLDARRALTWPEIAASVPGYAERDINDPALRRMFERDKEELREQGVPLETIGRVGSPDVRYRVRPAEYALPPIQVDLETAAVLALAARLWGSVAAGSTVRSALRKLDAGGAGDVLSSFDPGGLRLQLGQGEQAHAAVWQACREGKVVKFDYRKVRSEFADAREVEPWGVVCWRGRWYLVGYDRQRRAKRVFRLTRVVGDVKAVGAAGVVKVPVGVDLRAEVAAISERPASATATVSVPVGRCADLRRAATSVQPAGEGRDVLEVPYADAPGMGSWLRRQSGVQVIGPPALLEAYRAGLVAVLAKHPGAAA